MSLRMGVSLFPGENDAGAGSIYRPCHAPVTARHVRVLLRIC
jgi:hypothetical protein